MSSVKEYITYFSISHSKTLSHCFSKLPSKTLSTASCLFFETLTFITFSAYKASYHKIDQCRSDLGEALLSIQEFTVTLIRIIHFLMAQVFWAFYCWNASSGNYQCKLQQWGSQASVACFWAAAADGKSSCAMEVYTAEALAGRLEPSHAQPADPPGPSDGGMLVGEVEWVEERGGFDSNGVHQILTPRTIRSYLSTLEQ